MVEDKGKGKYVKIKNINPCWKFCYLFELFTLSNNTVFCDAFMLKFEKILFSNMFFSFIFDSKMIFRTAGKDQTKYFAQN